MLSEGNYELSPFTALIQVSELFKFAQNNGMNCEDGPDASTKLFRYMSDRNASKKIQVDLQDNTRS